MLQLIKFAIMNKFKKQNIVFTFLFQQNSLERYKY